MNRFFTSSLVAAFGLVAVGCGGGGDGAASGEAPATEQPAATEAPAASLSVPDWMSVDEAGKTVTLEIIAGKDDSNNRWNFNGYSRGNGTIVVPAGYDVVINFRNDDPNIAHSICVDSGPMATSMSCSGISTRRVPESWRRRRASVGRRSTISLPTIS